MRDGKPVDREARIIGLESTVVPTGSTDWMPFGNVTYVEAAQRMALWGWNMLRVRNRNMRIVVREKGSEVEFPHQVKVSLKFDITPLRRDEE